MILLIFLLCIQHVLGKGYLRLPNSKIDTYVGSEKELVSINIDMTKSDLLLFNSSTACSWSGNSNTTDAQALYQVCSTQASVFHDGNSKSFVKNGTQYSYSFESGDLVGYGNVWGIDTFNIGNKTIKGMQMSLLNQSTSVYGVLGVGFIEDEFCNRNNLNNGQSSVKYLNFPYQLKNQGIIKKAMYSLNSLPFSMSEFLFGAINHEKYRGDLVQIPLIDKSLQFKTDGIILNDLALSNSTITTIIDNNSYNLGLPPLIFNTIMNLLNANISSDYPDYYQTSNTNDTIYFKFGDLVIPISFQNLVDSNGLISIVQSKEKIVLGRPFLIDAYIVVDLEDEALFIGRAASPNNKDDITVVGKGSNSTEIAFNSASTYSFPWMLYLLPLTLYLI
ncbi:hypothetical protein CLIB1444_10S02058 [[Candida] jaroonii]|uniref:Uncharacterized protein n=1 Tax=[Candida] jaroonii TaxID=467808 RepID=A0ACA9YCC3_9ASCO|nr:hypothetical protein CLIB1444_10S02058 [[Candida] jaroonii]